MNDRMCKHKSIIAQSFWDYCADCGEIFIDEVFIKGTLCQHTKLTSQGAWLRCADCGEVIMKNEQYEQQGEERLPQQGFTHYPPA